MDPLDEYDTSGGGGHGARAGSPEPSVSVPPSPPPPPQLFIVGSESESGLEAVSSDSDLDSLSESDDEVDYLTHILKEIQDGTYTCLVCTSEIDPQLRVWLCNACYRVYDLGCIRGWAQRDLQRQLADNTNRNWRCPACKHQSTKIPTTFTCWCGKQKDPEPNHLLPFSCGNTCDKKYADCIHKCASQCHPGRHPVCSAIGPVLRCNCGEEERQWPCTLTPYRDNWLCGKPCTDHVCDLHGPCPNFGTCHRGLCGKCTQGVDAKCYCGQLKRSVPCWQTVPARSTTSTASWIGNYACNRRTTVTFDCGVHQETVECQPLLELLLTPQCLLSPGAVSTCPCGQHPIELLLGGRQRERCTDPVPECDLVCNKPLPCGHRCLLKCHAGECQCHSVLEVKCRCEQHNFLVPCGFLRAGEEARCTRKCTALLNCRRHVHNLEVCCKGEPMYLRRERERKKLRRRGEFGGHSSHDELNMTMEAEHICLKLCDRMLLCGLHRHSEAMCHAGACPPCLELLPDDAVCNCGKTVIPAPVRCGTKLHCDHQCVRETPCGHRREFHKCHPDDVACPKCTFLVEVECDCGKQMLTNVPCFKRNDRNLCGRACGMAMACGHPCEKICDRLCTAEGKHSVRCTKECHKVRSVCPHFCRLQCHHSRLQQNPQVLLCDKYLCQERVMVQCACKRVLKMVPCAALMESSSAIGTVLECDEVCAAEARDRELRAAFDLPDKGEEAGFVNPYPEEVAAVYAKQWKWCLLVEMQLARLVQENTPMLQEVEEAQAVAGLARKVVHFGAMNHAQRTFVHQLAECYQMYLELQDREPHRSVFVMFQTGRSAKPAYTLAAAARLEQEQEQARREQEQLRAMDEVVGAGSNTTPQPSEESETGEAPVVCNAVVFTDCFFGITVADFERELEHLVARLSIPEPEFVCVLALVFVLHSRLELVVPEVVRQASVDMKATVRSRSLAFGCSTGRYTTAGGLEYVDLGFQEVRSRHSSKRGTPRDVTPVVEVPSTNSYFAALV